jgi:hypothetical protein
MPNDDQPKSTASVDTPTTGTSITTPRKPTGFAAMATRLLETVGVLNKGSADSAAMPQVDDATQAAGISSNALNVTRVGGLAALIVGAGAAAIAIFNVNKATDKASIVVAAYIGVGVIVSSALLTAAIIISSDVRARATANQTASPSETVASTNMTKAATTSANTFGDAWYRALSMLHDAVDRLEHTPESPDAVWVDGSTAAWLDAAASTGKTQNLHPADDDQASLHARLSTGQSSVVSLLNKLANDRDPKEKTATITRIRSVLDSMDHSLPWPN